MENQSLNISQVLHKLEPGCLLLTPNSRLRRRLMQHFAKSHSADQGVCPSPAIFAFNQWCEENWLQLQDRGWPQARGILLSAAQRENLWQQLLQRSEAQQQLICPELLAGQADSAWATLQQWQLGQDALRQYQQHDGSLLADWADQFSQLCQRLGFISQEQMLQRLQCAFAEGELTQANKILLLEFDDIPPLTLALLQAAGTELERISLCHQAAPKTHLVAAESAEQEIQLAAQWAKQHLAQATAELPRIGIIDPLLGQRRERLERLFTQTFEPQYFLPDTERYTLPFNFSAGLPLAQCPLVDTALQLLKLNHQQLECERFCQLLYSPYWHNNHQLQHTISLAERSQLEYRLRNLQQRQLRTAQLRQIADKLSQRLAEDETAATQDYTWLGQRIMDFYYALPPQPGKQSAKAWAQLFIAQLQSLGWPGQRRLDSNEYQQLSQFYALFEELSSLDNCAQPLSLADALSHLSALAHKRHYQAKTPDCPITIVGSLEAAGLDFDYCWVLGMQQNNWPPAPAPNPLIPIELQRDKQMPHASAERELGFAQSLTASYLSCAPLVVLSYARMEGDQELQPSPLVKHLEPISPAELFHHSPACALENYRQALYQSRQLCWVDNRYGPGLSAAERQLGGSGVLKQQALCPFNAFAQYRLGAGSWPEPQLGLSPLERGNILHLALELFWQQCKDQAGLLALEDFELETQLEQVGQSAIDEVLSKRFDLGPGFRNIELARLLPILNAWMAEEMQRPAFKVLAIEQSQSLALGPLNLQLRLDRLDEYSDAQGQTQQLLIDYKTGQCSSQSWLGPRTEEPQLPLYSLANHNVNAIAFGQLNASFTGFIGFAAGREPAPGIDSLDNKKATDLLNKQWPGAPYQEDCGEQNWSELQQQWQQELLQLAERYDQGDASLDFKNRLAQEYSADLKGLQRLAEHSQKQTYWQANPGAEPNLSFEF